MNTTLRFTASSGNCYTEDDVQVIGIGDDPMSPDNYLIISRFDDGSVDDSIGIQSHLSEIEVSDAISELTLENNTLSLTIKKDKIIKTHFSNAIISLDDKEVDIKSVKIYLANIFKKSSTKIEIKQ